MIEEEEKEEENVNYHKARKALQEEGLEGLRLTLATYSRLERQAKHARKAKEEAEKAVRVLCLTMEELQEEEEEAAAAAGRLPWEIERDRRILKARHPEQVMPVIKKRGPPINHEPRWDLLLEHELAELDAREAREKKKQAKLKN